MKILRKYVAELNNAVEFQYVIYITGLQFRLVAGIFLFYTTPRPQEPNQPPIEWVSLAGDKTARE
jgi:hypothetical protein